MSKQTGQWVCWFTLATMSRWPWLAARCSGVSSPRFMTLMRAPRMMSMSTTPLLPSLHAQWRGLNPWSSLRKESAMLLFTGRRGPICWVSVADADGEHHPWQHNSFIWCFHWTAAPWRLFNRSSLYLDSDTCFLLQHELQNPSDNWPSDKNACLIRHAKVWRGWSSAVNQQPSCHLCATAPHPGAWPQVNYPQPRANHKTGRHLQQ